MAKTPTFGEVLEAANALPLADQAALLDVLHRRILEQRREQIAGDIADSLREFEAGGCHPKTADELVAEILS